MNLSVDMIAVFLTFVCSVTCTYVTEKYDARSASAADVSRGEIDTMKSEACQRFGSSGITDKQHVLLSGDGEDLNPVSCMSAEEELRLTDVLDVISHDDSRKNCEVSSSSASSLPACDLQISISNAYATTELASSCGEINVTSTPSHARLQSCDNRLSAAFTAQHKKSS